MTAAAFLALHQEPRPLVLPNVWDAVSARVFVDAGFPALATSSSAVAATLGYPDGERTPRDEMFAAVARIARSVDRPVSADFETGYGLSPIELVDRLVDAGVVGCNLEDSDPATGRLLDPAEQADRLAAVRAAAGAALVINARVDVFLRGGAIAEAVERGRRYRAAGADCIYPIMAPPELLPDLVAGIGTPLNAICLPDGSSPAELARLGATRITFGGALHRQATTELRSIAQSLAAELE